MCISSGLPSSLCACLTDAHGSTVRIAQRQQPGPQRKSQPKEKWIVHRFTAQQEVQDMSDEHLTR